MLESKEKRAVSLDQIVTAQVDEPAQKNCIYKVC